jgi:hypothetical protein
VAAREVGHAGGDRFTLRGGGAVIDCALEELRGSYEATYEMALR